MPDNKTLNAALAFIGKKLDKLIDSKQKVNVDLGITDDSFEKLGTKIGQVIQEKLQTARVSGLEDVTAQLGVIQSLLQKLLQRKQPDVLPAIAEIKEAIESINIETQSIDLSSVEKKLDNIKQSDNKDVIKAIQKLSKAFNNFKVDVPSTIKLDEQQMRVLGAARFGGGLSVKYPGENYSVIKSGRKVVTTGGTAVQLTTTKTLISKVDITAETDNTNAVFVGDSNVVAAAGSQQGYALYPGDNTTLYIDDLSKIYIDAITNGEGASFTYYA